MMHETPTARDAQLTLQNLLHFPLPSNDNAYGRLSYLTRPGICVNPSAMKLCTVLFMSFEINEEACVRSSSASPEGEKPSVPRATQAPRLAHINDGGGMLHMREVALGGAAGGAGDREAAAQ